MTQLVDDVAELLILMPHLADALERDAVTGDNEPVSGGGDPAFGLPVNADVLGALTLLTSQVPRAARWAAAVLAERPEVRTVEGHLWHVPRWHERMLVTAAVVEADTLARHTAALLAAVKLALGLRTHDRRLGQFCPLHDEPLSELVLPGAEATLEHGDRGMTVAWASREAAVCRSCGASWSPAEYLTLGRLMRQADTRRTA